MRHIIRIFILLILSATTYAQNNYYWVGGTGNWSDVSTHWATTSGGSTFHTSLPSSSSNVFFDANSFSAPGQTVTLTATATLIDMSWAGVTNNPTFTASDQTLNILGSLMLASGMTFNTPSVINFQSTTTGKIITTGGKTLGTINLNGIGGGWTLQDGLTCGNLYLINGSFNTNSQTINANFFESSNTNVRSLTIGTSTFNLFCNACSEWNVNATNLTYSAGATTFNMKGGNTNFNGGGLTYNTVNSILVNGGFIYDGTFNNVNLTLGGSVSNCTITNFTCDVYPLDRCNNSTITTATISKNANFDGPNTFGTLNLTGAGAAYTFKSNATQTITTALNITGGTCSSLISINSSTLGTQATISMASGTPTINYVNLKDMKALGGATFTANNAVNLGNNTGWTIGLVTSKNYYWIGGTGNWTDGSHWSLTSGGAASGCGPSVLDNVFFDANSFSAAGQTVTIAGPASLVNMNWTGVTNNPRFDVGGNTLNIYGSLTLASAMTVSNWTNVNFLATTTGQTITTAGKSVGTSTFVLNGIGGGWTLQDGLTCGSIYLTNGSFNTNSQTIHANLFESTNTNVRSLTLGTSTFNLFCNACSEWNVNATNLTYSAGATTFNMKGGNTNFNGGGLTYNTVNSILVNGGFIYDGTFNNVNLTLGGSVSNCTITNFTCDVYPLDRCNNSTITTATISKNANFDGPNTFGTLILSSSTGSTYTFKSGVTQTVTNLQIPNASGGFPVYLYASTIGSRATISQTSGTFCTDYTRIRDINVTGGATFVGGPNCQDISNNLGWNFITGIATPTVTISAVPNGTICLGSSVTFTAAITNGGASQNYNWFVNGVSVQNGSSNTYTSTNITNGATVLCVLTATPVPTTVCSFSFIVNSNTLTMAVSSPPTLLTGFGSALSFDGTNDYVQLTGNINAGNNFTFNTLFNASSTSNTKILASNGMEICLCNGEIDVYPYNTRSSGLNISLNTWHKLSVVYNNPTLTVYLDGNSVATGSSGTPIALSTPRLGQHHSADCCKLTGALDETSFWNVSLSPAQTNTYFNQPLTGTESGLMAYYDYNQGNPGGTNAGVTSLLDRSSNANNATLNNFALTGSSSNWIPNTITGGGNNSISANNQGVCLGGTPTSLSVSAVGSNLTYQWYSNSTASNTGGTLIGSATNKTYSPSTAALGTTYYYVVVSPAGGCPGATSTVSGAVSVVNPPVITVQPSTAAQSICGVGASASLSVTATGSNLTYQWYRNTTATTTGGTLINGATGSTYIPSSPVNGVFYYYVVVSSGTGCFVTSNVSGAITNSILLNKLDLQIPSAVSYSLRLLSTCYNGYAIQVRRSSDDALLDIGFDTNGNLDVAALRTFVSSGNGFVTIWYDQSGNGRNLIQTNTSRQPTIVNGGVVYLKNDKPTIYVDNVDDGMNFPGTSYLTSMPFSVNAVAGSNSSNGGARRALDARENNWLLGPYDNQHGWYSNGWNNYGTYPAWSTTSVEVFTVIQPSSNANTSWRNGVSLNTGNSKTTPGVINIATGGNHGQIFDGYLSEINAFSTDLILADLRKLEKSQGDYYGISVRGSTAISLHPSSVDKDVCQGSITDTLFAKGEGTSIRYQWYKNTTSSNTGGTLITGATARYLVIPSATLGTSYYYAVVTGSVGTPITSNVSGAITVNAQSIVVSSQLSNAAQSPAACVQPNALTIGATGTNLTYQWYSNVANSNNNGVVINGATSNTFMPSKAGASYYYVVLSSVGCKVKSTTSGLITLTKNALDNAGLTSSTPATVAYSLRQLSSCYFGKAIQVRRSSDFALQDIGFTNTGELDTAALKTFIGVNSGFVKIWYDQSGNEINAIQTKEQFQPRIVNAGVVDRENGKPAAIYDGTNDLLEINSWAPLTSATATVVFKPTISPSSGAAEKVGLWEFGTQSDAAYWAYAGNNIYDGFGTNSRRNAITDLDLDQQINQSSIVLKTDSSAYWLNGSPFLNQAQSTISWATNPKIGGISYASIRWGGTIPEIIIFPTSISHTQRKTLEVNQGTYYGITMSDGRVVINTQPSTSAQTVCVGTPLSPLSVTTTGTLVTYQWFSNSTNSNIGGTLIPGATNSSYTPSSLVAGAKYYYVEVSSAIGATVKSAVSGLITSTTNTIVITTQPSTSNQVVQACTQAATINVAASGSTITYQWYSNENKANTEGVSIAGATSATYTPAKSGDNYYYVVISSGVCTTASNTSGLVSIVANPLDKVGVSSGGMVAYSLRLLSSCYQGSAIKVRRSSDNGILDIGFTAQGDLDTTALKTFAGSGNAYITIWYDQSSNNRNMVQTNTGYQPQIIFNGNFKYIGTRPTVDFYNNKVLVLTGESYSVSSVASVIRSEYTNWPSYHAILDASQRIGGLLEAGNSNFHSNKYPLDLWKNGVLTPPSTSLSPTNSGMLLTFNTHSFLVPGLGIGNYDLGGGGGSILENEVIGFSSKISNNDRQLINYNQGNYYGISVSTTPTVITSHPLASAQAVCIGGSVTPLKVTATGVSVTYQWYKNSVNSNSNGTLIAGETNSEFSPPVTTVGTTYYYAVATGLGGSSIVTSNVSGSITVSALNAPVISKQPSSYGQIVCEGNVATSLSLLANGTGLTYQWYSNSVAVNYGGNAITGATNINYTPSLGGSNYYYAVVTNAAGCSVNTAVSGVITLNGVSSAPAFGNALNFDGSNDFVTINQTTAVRNLGVAPFTMEAMIYLSNTSGVNSIIRKSGDYNLYINSNRLAAEVWPAGEGVSNSFKEAVGSTINIQANKWTHVAAVWNGSAFSLYVDGVLDPANTNNRSAGGVDNLTIGKSITFDQPFNGKIDELRIWNIARDQSDILSSLRKELTGSEGGLVSYYNFNQGIAEGNNTSVTVLTNKTGNTNDGTLNNFTLTGSTSNWVANTNNLNEGITLDKAGITVGSAMAYSLRKLSSCYAGNAIQVRRSSDNATKDIGFTYEGDLDSTALKSFVGSGNGFITIWYDQSSNNRNMVPLATNYEPQIIFNGVFKYIGNRPTIDFNSNKGLTTSLSGSPIILKKVAGVIKSESTNFPNYHAILDANQRIGGLLEAGNNVFHGNKFPTELWRNGVPLASNGSLLPVNKTLVVNFGTHSDYVTCLGIGNYDCGGGGGSVLETEVIAFSSSLTTSNQDALNSNQGGYYNVKVTTANTAIGVQPSSESQSVCAGGLPVKALKVVASGSNLAYQWYSNTVSSNTGGTLIVGANNDVYTPSITVNGTLYYYVVVSGSSGTVTSSLSGPIIVSSAASPVITVQPSAAAQSLFNCQGGTPLTVAATGTGITYQWYKSNNNINTGGNAISGALSSTLVLSGTAKGTSYYYATATSSDGCFTNSAPSGPITTSIALDKVGVANNISAAAAYSLRLMSSCYYGKAIRVRRSIDNATMDIGFTAQGDLDTTSLKSFIGNNSGYVTVWYDQSGNAKNATQTSEQNQPRIINNGVLDLFGERPSISALGNNYFNLPNGTVPVGNSNYTINFPMRVTGDPGNFGIIGSGDYGAGNRVNSIRTEGNGQMLNYWWGNDLNSPVLPLKNSNRIMTYQFDNTSGRKFYDAGSLINENSNTNIDNTANNNTIFKTYGGEFFLGNIPELILFSSSLTPLNRENLESSQGAYYAVSVSTTGTRLALQPSTQDQTACLGGSANGLYVVANGVNLRYQWYKNTNPTTVGATLIPGATNDSYSPIETVSGDYYYYVIVTGSDASITSNFSGKISINNTQAAVITVQPSSTNQIICTGASVNPLEVVATGTGLTYQWFKSTVSRNFNGEAIVGATTSTFTPPTNVSGATFYYAVVSNAGGCSVNSNVSGSIAVGILLDKTGATISADYAYSLRQLSSCYTGSAIRVRRNSDNQEINIGFDANGNLDTAALKIFVHSAGSASVNTRVGVSKFAAEITTSSDLVNIYGKLGNGEGVTKYGEAFTVTPPLVPENAFITTWFDQSGNGRNLTQQQTYWQPQITFDGNMKYIGARPTLDFNNNKGVFFNNSPQVQLSSVLAVLKSEYDYFPNYHAILDGTSNRLGGLLEGGNTVFHSNRYPLRLWRNGASISNNSSLRPVNDQLLIGYNTYNDFVNGLCIGNADGGGGGGAVLEAEAIGFSTQLPVKYRTAIEANMGAYYGFTTSIITHPDTTEQVNCVASRPATLRVVAKGSQLRYQWYSNTIKSNVGGTPIFGENATSYIPSSATPGIKYYYVVVSGSSGPDVASNVSGAIYTNALAINITSQPSTAVQSVSQCTDASPLTIIATGSDIKYKWYYTTTNGNTDGKEIDGATTNSYIPNVAGDYYYYSVLSSLGCSLASDASGLTTILPNPLDLAGLPNAVPSVVAYSVRKLSSCYNGKAIKVRRSSDDTLLDIGFLPSGALDTVSLINFAGTGNAFVYKWYDQSGRRNDMLQDLNNYQPQIVFDGRVKHIGSKVAVDFAGNKGLIFRTTQIRINQVITAVESENNIFTGYHALLDGTNGRLGGMLEGSNTLFHGNRYPTALWRNGVSIANNSSLSPVKNTIICSYTTYTDQVNGLCIGNHDGNNNNGGGAMQSEVIAFPSVVSDDERTAAENNMGSYFGLATRVVTQPDTTSQTRCQNIPAQAISVVANAMNPTYQWYSNTTNSNTGGTLIAGATSSSYTPSTAAGGKLYYYVVVSGSIGTATSDVSGAVTVTVPTTVITAQPNTAGETVTVCGSVNVTDLSFTATGPASTYQWYSNTSSSNVDGTLLNGATNRTFTPNVEGPNYYYAVITSGACTLATNPSGLVTITFSPLDKLGVNTQSPAAAFGLRLLTTCYQGKAIKVRRSSDDAMLDIGFKVNGDLDDDALTAFIGNSDGYIVKWYDQSGTGLDASQSDLTKQPKIATAGVIYRENGKPTILYDGTDDHIKLTSWNSRGADATGFIVFKPTASEGNSVALWEFGTNTDASYWAAGGNTIYDGFGTNSRRSVASPLDLDQQTNVATVQIYNYESEYWLNGNPLMSPENISVDWSNTPTIGGTSNGNRWAGSISELIVYNKAISVIDRQNIEGSEGSYYGVAGTTGILTQPSTINQIYCVGNTTAEISVLAKGINLTFQWYRNTSSSNTGGTLIAGATKSTINPSSATVGSTYYYVTITGSDGLTVVSNPSGVITINPQPSTGGCKDGLTEATAGESGMQLRTDYPAYESGWYWIKSSKMPNALQMYVDMVEDGGGYDFYIITAGPSVSTVTEVNGGTPLGLDLVMPRSKEHWSAMSKTVLQAIIENKAGGGNYDNFFQTAYGVYRSNGARNGGGYYNDKIMRSKFYGGTNNASDWRVKDGGRWWLRDETYGEPNGDYGPNGLLGGGGLPNPYNLTNINFNDLSNNYLTGSFYLVSTNAKK